MSGIFSSTAARTGRSTSQYLDTSVQVTRRASHSDAQRLKPRASSLSERSGGERAVGGAAARASALDIGSLIEVVLYSIDEAVPHKNGNWLRFLLWDGHG